MAFIRNFGREKFTVIDNVAIRDKNLSLKSLGLLVKLLSLPDDWEFSENGLEKSFEHDGQASIRAGLKDLETFGYLKRVKRRDKKGRITKIEWIIYECPQLENPHLENPQVDNPKVDNPKVENPHLENPPQLNTNTFSTNIESTEELKREGPASQAEPQKQPRKKFSPPSVDDVRAYCQSRQNGIDPQRFVDFYQSNGWMVGKNHMKDWKAAVRTWEGRRRERKQDDDNPFLEMLREEEQRNGQSGNIEDYVTV